MKLQISEIKETFVSFLDSPEDDGRIYAIFFNILERLYKDRLFIRDVPVHEFALFYGLKEREFTGIIRYCTGLDYRDFIEMLRALEAFALSRRLETYGLKMRQICRLANANYKLADRLIYSLLNVSMVGFLRGLKKNSQIPFEQENIKSISRLRNEQQKRNTAFIKDLKALKK